MTRVFFDASVIFSALHSKEGASYILVKLVEKNVIAGIITETIVEEICRNAIKLRKKTVTDIYQFIADYHFIVLQALTIQANSSINKIQEKDQHVITGAITTQCDYLVTFDRKHLNNSSSKQLFPVITILSPQEMLRIILSSH